MRTLRSNIISLFSIVGIIATFVTLLMLTGILIGILTPGSLTGIFTLLVKDVMVSRASWWLGAFCGWAGSVWMVWFLIRTNIHPSIPISEDENGAVEVSTDALCSLARTEARSQGVKGPCRAEFTRKLGAPILQLFCDLTAGNDVDGPVAWGEMIRREIEERLLTDFRLKGIKVAIIHQPNSRGTRNTKPSPVG